MIRGCVGKPNLTCIQEMWLTSINLLDSGTTASTTTTKIATSTRHATLWHATTTGSLVHLHHDWIHDALNLFLLGFKLIFLRQLILVKPIKCILDRLLNFVLIITLKLVLQLLFLQGVSHGEAIILETVLCLNFRLVCLIFGAVLFGLLNHAIDLRLRKATLFICDGDLIGFAC